MSGTGPFEDGQACVQANVRATPHATEPSIAGGYGVLSAASRAFDVLEREVRFGCGLGERHLTCSFGRGSALLQRPSPGTILGVARHRRTNRRKRGRVFMAFERVLLGAGMSIVVFFVERLLKKVIAKGEMASIEAPRTAASAEPTDTGLSVSAQQVDQ
jgi:hypothetical protein